VEQDHEKGLLEIIGSLNCPKDFECYRSGFETLCKAEDVVLDSYLHCLEKDPVECKFSVILFGDRYYCECPLRIYISKKLKK
jgi:hypothetical protein